MQKPRAPVVASRMVLCEPSDTSAAALSIPFLLMCPSSAGGENRSRRIIPFCEPATENYFLTLLRYKQQQ